MRHFANLMKLIAIYFVLVTSLTYLNQSQASYRWIINHDGVKMLKELQKSNVWPTKLDNIPRKKKQTIKTSFPNPLNSSIMLKHFFRDIFNTHDMKLFNDSVVVYIPARYWGGYYVKYNIININQTDCFGRYYFCSTKKSFLTQRMQSSVELTFDIHHNSNSSIIQTQYHQRHHESINLYSKANALIINNINRHIRYLIDKYERRNKLAIRSQLEHRAHSSDRQMSDMRAYVSGADINIAMIGKDKDKEKADMLLSHRRRSANRYEEGGGGRKRFPKSFHKKSTASS